MSLVTWNGKLLLSPSGHLTLGPAADECCCPTGCCGRLVPGPSSLQGPEYYPLVLHCRITKGTCALPDPAVEFDATWDPTINDWVAENIDLGDVSLATLSFTCTGTTAWDASLTWGVCQGGGGVGSVLFDLIPTLTAGECNPVNLDATTPNMIGLMCCGSLGGGTVVVEVWE